MPGLRVWQRITAAAVSTALGTPELGEVFQVLDWDAAKPAGAPPFGVVRTGAAGTWYDATPGNPYGTTCLGTGYLTVYLFAGGVGDESTTEVLTDLVERLLASRLKSMRTDPLNTNGHVPPLGVVSQPAPIEFGSTLLWGCSMPLEFPIHP